MKLNRKQRIILIIALVLLGVSALFPPWRFTFEGNPWGRGAYGFVLRPPLRGAVQVGVRIDIARLAAQWVAILAFAGVGIYVVRQTDK